MPAFVPLLRDAAFKSGCPRNAGIPHHSQEGARLRILMIGQIVGVFNGILNPGHGDIIDIPAELAMTHIGLGNAVPADAPSAAAAPEPVPDVPVRRGPGRPPKAT
ncbi:hypothetical protein [Streptacidiphilus albus]|uniref:hypothetical protein n=1 Tax=Streptacidiphilus albus TaxID=105425 RepID=UPI00128DF7C2|nr:hypothetical protein [Streptacidiphilus albus]